MSDTKKRYEEAGLLPPLHEARVSPELHVVNTELQPVEVVPAPGRVVSEKPKRAPSKRTAAKTTKSTAARAEAAPSTTTTTKES